MRRISLAFPLTALLLPSSAHANQHQIRVNEVLLSSGGDDAVQFVELRDAATEDFPNTYFLGVYDADGGSLGTISLPDPDPLTPGRIFISTAEADAAFETEGDAELTVALPAAGQVCFEALPSTKIACTSWGCINTVVNGSYETSEGAPPPDGQSLQRQGSTDSYELGNPTPDANNVAGDPAPACSTDPDAGPSEIDAGSDGDADAGPDSPDGGGGGGGDGSDGGDDDDSGCGCGTSSPRSAAGGLLMLGVFVVAGRIRRLRGRGTRT